MRKALASAFALAGIFMMGIAAATAAPEPDPADEGELLKQIKSDVFDQEWATVLSLCDQLIGQYPKSQALPRAFYYRAQALEHVKGREAEAVEAYGAFLTKFPGETGALKEDAVLSRLTLITSLYLKGNKTFLPLLLQTMDAGGYQRIYAAIQASKLDSLPARTKALPILKECSVNEPDTEVKNECIVALLRINPKEGPPALPAVPPGSKNAVPNPPARPGRPAPPSPDAIKLINVEVFDKAKKAISVRVHLPIAFAELLLDSLDDGLKNELLPHFQEKPGFKIDVNKFWEAIKQGGRQTLVEFDNDEVHVKVWIE